MPLSDINFGNDRSFGFRRSTCIRCDSDVNFGDEGPRRRAVTCDELCSLFESRLSESLEVDFRLRALRLWLPVFV